MIVYNPHPRLIMVSSGVGWVMVPPNQEVEVPDGNADKFLERGDLILVSKPEPEPAPEEEPKEEPKPEPKEEPKAKPKKKAKAKTSKKASKKASKG